MLRKAIWACCTAAMYSSNKYTSSRPSNLPVSNSTLPPTFVYKLLRLLHAHHLVIPRLPRLGMHKRVPPRLVLAELLKLQTALLLFRVHQIRLEHLLGIWAPWLILCIKLLICCMIMVIFHDLGTLGGGDGRGRPRRRRPPPGRTNSRRRRRTRGRLLCLVLSRTS